ncbi:MAG TPA: transcriptional regulator GutM [Acidiphilium sp.]
MSVTTLIAIFAILWILQIAGTAWQMRHYRRVLGEIATRWRDGAIGVGNAKARLGKGMILILVVGTDDRLRAAMIMQGRSVFAKFRPLPALVGKPLDELRDESHIGAAPRDAGFARACARAIEQIDRLRTPATAPASTPATTPTLALAA